MANGTDEPAHHQPCLAAIDGVVRVPLQGCTNEIRVQVTRSVRFAELTRHERPAEDGPGCRSLNRLRERSVRHRQPRVTTIVTSSDGPLVPHAFCARRRTKYVPLPTLFAVLTSA